MVAQSKVADPGPRMTQAQLAELPVSFDLTTAGRAWGFGRTKSYELVRQEEFPCPVRRIGNSYRITRADLLRSLGLDPVTAANSPDP
jgi:hypothetical protein